MSIKFTDYGVTDDEAWAVALFLRRVGWTEIRQNAQNDDEANLIRDGIEKFSAILADQGYAPR